MVAAHDSSCRTTNLGVIVPREARVGRVKPVASHRRRRFDKAYVIQSFRYIDVARRDVGGVDDGAGIATTRSRDIIME